MARERVRSGVMVDQRAQREITARRCWRASRSRSTRARRSATCALGQQQIVEIARALAQDARVLIMDEPTSALSAAEVEVLFRVIRELTAGGVAIVYISHHLEEALEIADRVVVLRDGVARRRGRGRRRRPRAGSIEQMVGRNPDELFPDEHAETGASSGSRSTGSSSPTRATRAGCRVDDVTLTVRAGEIVGLYGLMGAGRTELLETLAGRLAAADGRVLARRAADRARLDRRAHRPRHRARARGPSARRARPDDVGRPEPVAGEPAGSFVRGPFVSGDRERAAVDAR